MANKIDGEFIKKHHFWLLFIPAGLFVMLSCIFVFADVDSETSKKDGENKSELTAQQAKAKAASKKTLDELAKQKAELEKQQKLMWKQAWTEQASLYPWPKGYSPSKEFDDAKRMPFGSVELDDRRFSKFRGAFRDPNIYLAEYDALVESLLPMQFNGGRDAILRIQKWNPNLVPNSEDIWLALEDLWIQSEILTTINSINQKAAQFKRIKGDAAKPREDAAFQSDTWQVQLKVTRLEGAAAPNGAGDYLVGKIRNISQRLQVFGVGNHLVLKVWINDTKRDPFLFVIEGTSLPGDPDPQEDRPEKWVTIKTIKPHLLPVDIKTESIVKVEQLFDTRTVPIKRVEALSLGKLSDRTSGLSKMMSIFSKKAADGTGGAAKSATDTTKPAVGTPSPTGLSTSPIGNLPKGGGFDGSQGSGSTTQYGLDRLRYLAVTPQVRRMPLGFTVVTDQAYMNEVLQVMANTKLRFQTTQSHWSRFHGTLTYGADAAKPAIGTTPVPKGGGRPDLGGYNPNLAGSANPTNNREDQFSANLLEISVYGIISIYEKFEVKGAVFDKESLDKKDKDDKGTPKLVFRIGGQLESLEIGEKLTQKLKSGTKYTLEIHRLNDKDVVVDAVPEETTAK